ncbi:hypothetical protein ACFWMR_00610 [Amycolatopsis thailandensis]|uniref:hypothetical protein n=1 Tax=Amycolatopsis thailandensis TaxID=589330 RepID=UPI003663DF3F
MSETVEARPGPGTTNPLIKTDAASDESSLEGAGILQDFWDTGAKISSGDWAEGLANLANGAVGLVGMAVDPLGTLMSAGFGWLIEHLWFVRDLMDMLLGDQVALDNMIGTWENIGKELEQVGDDLGKAVDHDSVGWTGPAADAYRTFAKDRANLYSGLASGATAMAMLVSMCKTILAVVRSIVRDLISEALAKLVSILMRYPGPAAVAGFATEGLAKVLEYVQKCMGWIKKLAKAFGEANRLFKTLIDLFVKVKDALAPIGRGIAGGVKAVATTLDDAGAFTTNLLKESLKNVGKETDKLRKDDKPKEPGPSNVAAPPTPAPAVRSEGDRTRAEGEPPIFDQPGSQRISGSLE